MMYWGQSKETIERIIEQAFDEKPVDGIAVLKGVVSRKKQIIPPLMNLLQDTENDDEE